MIELILLATAGAFIHLFFKYNNARKRGVKFNWQNQMINTLSGIITVSVIIYVKDDLKSIVEINKVTAVILGYLGDSAFKNLVKTFKTKLSPDD